MLRALRTSAAICLAAWVCLASRAAALELSWSAPAGCPEHSAVEARLTALLGEREKPPDLRARLKVESQRAGFKLTLRLDGGRFRGTRVLTGADCGALADTAAWLIATAIDPGLTLLPPPPPPSEPVPEPTVPVVPPPPAAKPAAVLPPPARPSPWVLHADLHGGLWHVLDRPPGQAALGFALGSSWRWLLGELRADFGLPQTSGIGVRGATVRASNQSLGVAACGQWGSWLRAGPCLGLDALRSHADARGLSADNLGPQSRYWADVRAGAQLSARLGWPIELFLEGGAGVAVSPRPRFRVTGTTDSLQGGRVSAYARLGLRFRYPVSRSARR